MSEETQGPQQPSGKQWRKAPETEDLLATANKQLPFSDEAEKALLSCVLHDQERTMPLGWLEDLRASLPVEAFYVNTNRILMATFYDMAKRTMPLDVVSVTNVLRDQGLLERVGGASLLSEIYTFIPIDAHFLYYLKVVRNKWLLRQQIHACVEGIHNAYECGKEAPDQDATAIVSATEQSMFRVLESSQNQNHKLVLTSTEAAAEWVGVFEKICAQTGEIPGIKTGILDMDRTFHGLAVDKDGDFFLNAGFPGMGKTGLFVTYIENMGIEQNIPMLNFALEMGHTGIHHRLVLGRAGVNVSASRNGFRPKGSDGAIMRAVDEIQKAPLYWVDKSSIEIDELCALTVMHIRKHGVRIIGIDHFAQIRPSSKEGKRDKNLGQIEILERLHDLRRTWGILVILFAQLDKAAREKNERNKPPSNGDLRGTSELCDYPTQIAFIHRPDEVFKWHTLKGDEAKGQCRQTKWIEMTNGYRHDFPEAWHDGRKLEESGKSVHQADYEEHARIIITKNRNGATTDEICLRYQKEFQRFRGRTLKLYSGNATARQVKLPGF